MEGQEMVSGYIVGLLMVIIKDFIKKIPDEHRIWLCKGEGSTQDTLQCIWPSKATGPAFSKTIYQKYSTNGKTKLVL